MFSHTYHTEIVNEHRARYFETKSHREKREYTTSIVESICEVGRFLKRDKHSWKEATFETARQKVAHALQYRQRCLSNISDEIINDNISIASSIRGEAQYPESELQSKRPFEVEQSRRPFEEDIQQLDLETSTEVTDKYPSNLRVVSDVMGLHISNQNNTQQFRSSFDSGSNKYFYYHQHDKLNDALLASMQCSQPFNASIVSKETSLSKALDEPSAEEESSEIPLPLKSMLRSTSDFSFGDFSLNGDFMSNIKEDCDHDDI
jgi:hypothetical protein